jgi:UDP-N-acetylglucosamine transferase subunit ALG13
MIFVTVGTQPNGFMRCLNEVEALVLKYKIEEEVVAQIGNTKFESKVIKVIPFLGENEFKEYIKKASVVITHAGSGAIFSSIKAGKKTIAIARLHEYNEMADNHQTELVKKLALDGYILDGTYSLSDAWEKISDFKPRENDFQNRIVDFLDGYISEVISK